MANPAELQGVSNGLEDLGGITAEVFQSHLLQHYWYTDKQ
jgi:hypothetical protein